MTFREFVKLSEQGTAVSATGLNAAGRAGQSAYSPEMGVTQMPTNNPDPVGQGINTPKTIAPSAFNTSSKFKTLVPRAFGPLNAGGVKNVFPAPPSPISPRGFQSSQIQPLQPNPGINVPNAIKIPKPGSGT